MSREIKFRVWNTQEGKFHLPVEGDRLDSVLHYWEITKHVEFPQQFTGLKDVNGKEIYEGDIIKCKPIDVIHSQDLFKYNNFEFLTSAVYWSKEYCCFETDFNSSCFAESENVIEVIGNIYETPVLLQS